MLLYYPAPAGLSNHFEDLISETNRQRRDPLPQFYDGTPQSRHPGSAFEPGSNHAAASTNAGKKLQLAREKAGFSQEELAKRIGCTQASLSNYKLGKRRLYLGDLQRIGLLLGKQVTYFLDETEEEPTLSLDEFNRIIKEQYLHEILLAAKDLKIPQRKSVLDYIR